MTARKVLYKTYHVNNRGEEWGSGDEKEGNLISFTPDYQIAVIEDDCGKIIHIPIARVRFKYPRDDI